MLCTQPTAFRIPRYLTLGAPSCPVPHVFPTSSLLMPQGFALTLFCWESPLTFPSAHMPLLLTCPSFQEVFLYPPSLGYSPASSHRAVLASFLPLPVSTALIYLHGSLGDGQPLGELLPP